MEADGRHRLGEFPHFIILLFLVEGLGPPQSTLNFSSLKLNGQVKKLRGVKDHGKSFGVCFLNSFEVGFF